MKEICRSGGITGADRCAGLRAQGCAGGKAATQCPLGPGVDLAYIDHILVWVDRGASLTYVPRNSLAHRRPLDRRCIAVWWRSLLMRVRVFALVELQSWGEHVWNFSHERAHVGRDGNLDWDLWRYWQPSDQEFLRTGPGGARRLRANVGLLFHRWRSAPGSRYPAKPPGSNTTSDLCLKAHCAIKAAPSGRG